MQNDLKRMEQLWGLAVQTAGFGVWDLDPRSQTVQYSPEWKERLGYGSTDGPDAMDAWRSRVHPDDLSAMALALSAHLEGLTPGYEHEFRLRAADGSYRWVLSRGRVVERDAQGRALRAVGTLTDLTDRRQAEALRAERDRAETASRAKSEFLSRMSHELRTPLNAVLGFAQLLSSRIGSGGDTDLDVQRRYVAHIEKAGWQLVSMVDNVLELSRFESGQLQLDIRPVPLAPLLQELADATRAPAQKQALRMNWPVAPAAAAVLADPDRLKQVLLMLLDNAIRFNRPDGAVTLDLQPLPGAWAVSVRDTGIGISEQQLAHLFEPFNRQGRPKNAAEGFGISLALTRWLVDTMGASLAVRSTMGVGSSFTLTLPAPSAGG